MAIKNRFQERDPILSLDLIIQHYYSEIGEYSYFFFDQKFPHAILQKPKSDDLIAHRLFVAETLFYQPQDDEILQVQAFLNPAPKHVGYARVVFFKRNNDLILMELELIEPYLYFKTALKQAIYDFCEAIISRKNKLNILQLFQASAKTAE